MKLVRHYAHRPKPKLESEAITLGVLSSSTPLATGAGQVRYVSLIVRDSKLIGYDARVYPSAIAANGARPFYSAFRAANGNNMNYMGFSQVPGNVNYLQSVSKRLNTNALVEEFMKSITLTAPYAGLNCVLNPYFLNTQTQFPWVYVYLPTTTGELSGDCWLW